MVDKPDYQPPARNMSIASNKSQIREINENEKYGMFNRMNSTQIENKENQYYRDASIADMETSDSALDESNILSNRSSMKEIFLSNQNPTSANANKRLRSPEPDISGANIALNNLNIDSPKRDDESKSSAIGARKCISQMSNFDEKINAENNLREYVPYDAKFSLPNYGLNRMRQSNNVSPINAVQMGRSNSQCSTHSEFTQNDGKFPLKANKSALTWECIKLRKSAIKSFVIKNVSEKRLNLKMEVLGPGFQIASTDANKESIILHGNECRTIYINFCPTVIGKAIGK